MSNVVRMRPAGRPKNGLINFVRHVAGERSDLVFVEIGSYSGESAEILLSSGLVSRLYCVDPWRGGYAPGDYASGSDMTAVEAEFDRRHAADGRVIKVKGTIDDFMRMYVAAGKLDRPVDVVYIDGNHLFVPCYHDIETAVFGIRPRLAVSGHDYDNVKTRRVRLAVDMFFGHGPKKTFSDGSWVVSTEQFPKQRHPIVGDDSPLWGLAARLCEKRMKVRPDYVNPSGLTSKLMWLSRYWQHPIKTICADKFAVRKYVASLGLSDILVPLVGTWDRVSEIDFSKLPDGCILKCNHGCGYNIVWRNGVSSQDTVRNALTAWMSEDYGLRSAEVHYSPIHRKIICEPLISDGPLLECQVICVNGVPQSIVVRRKGDKGAFWTYSVTWAPTNDRTDRSPSDIEKPAYLDKLLAAARRLASPLPFVRVDFFMVGSRFYFAELTVTPAANMLRNYTAAFRARLSDILILPEPYVGYNRPVMPAITDVEQRLRSKSLANYRRKTNRAADLEDPKDLGSKLMWLMWNWRHPLKTTCADKYAVRRYVSDCGLSRLLVQLYGVWESPDNIDFGALPDKCIFKCNHGCGYNTVRMPGSDFDAQSVRKLLRKWLSSSYASAGGEIHYAGIPRRVVCEELVSDTPPVELQVWCVNGEPDSILACRKGAKAYTAWTYSLDWNRIHERTPESSDELAKPPFLQDLIDAARRLAAPFPFVRVDFLTAGSRFYFGKLTFTPACNALTHFTRAFHTRLCAKLTLPAAYVQAAVQANPRTDGVVHCPVRWARHFDRVYVIHHLPLEDRLPRLKEELLRVGLSTSGVLEWRYTTKSPLDKIIYDGFKGRVMRRVAHLNQVLELHKVFSEALALGYRRILVLENDVAFLKDLDQLEHVLSAIPDGYDFVQLEKFVHPGKAEASYLSSVQDKAINDSFFDVTGVHYPGASCNVYTRVGMQKMLDAINERLPNYDSIYDYTGLRGACAIKNAAVQVVYGNAVNLNAYHCTSSRLHATYATQGIDYADYGVPDGYCMSGVYREGRPLACSVGIWDRFDAAFVLSHTDLVGRRLHPLLRELDRVGLSGKVRFFLNYRTPLNDVISRGVLLSRAITRTSHVDCTMGHYRMVKTAYELGYEHVLFLEDDLRFLHDVGRLRDIVSALPDNYDLAKFNWVVKGVSEESVRASMVNGFWADISRFHAKSTGAYALSRRGMEKRIRSVERALEPASGGNRTTLRIADHYDMPEVYDPDFVHVGCCPLAAIQFDMGDRLCSVSNLVKVQRPVLAGLTFADYGRGLPHVDCGRSGRKDADEPVPVVASRPTGVTVWGPGAGQLCNQLYHVFRVFRMGDGNLYRPPNPVVAQRLAALGLGYLLAVDSASTVKAKEFHGHRQGYGVDFSPAELQRFIGSLIVPSDAVRDARAAFGFPDDVVAVHIRCKDYITGYHGMFSAFDRVKYVDDALSAASAQGRFSAVRVFSDDNKVAARDFGPVFKRHGLSAEYVDERDPVSALVRLALHRRKILFNSTYSTWSGFIGDALVPGGASVIVPSVFYVRDERLDKVRTMRGIAPPAWTFLPVTLTVGSLKGTVFDRPLKT